jgi:hypothetical protein
MQRVNNMKADNPRGTSTFLNEYEAVISPFTKEEYDRSMSKYKCAMTALIAVADSRKCTSAGLDPELAERAANLSYQSVVEFYKSNNISLRHNSNLLERQQYYVPRSQVESAYESAKHFYREGVMPTHPYAGAFMDIDNMIAYKERGEPDLALIKATATPPATVSAMLSSRKGVDRITPCRDTEGEREETGGDMPTAYLTGRYPSRPEAIDWLRDHDTLLSCSVKIETNKYPVKNRIITAADLNTRRIMSEFEFNNGSWMTAVPGFSVGADPADVKAKMYAAMKDDVRSGYKRVMVSLDLSSFSTGMHWDIQKAANEVLERAYDGGTDAFSVLNKCTNGSLMGFSQKGIHLISRNVRGANYEGLDGKRNTLIHCTIWYLARMAALERGVEGSMRALLYIDDGTACIDVPKSTLVKDVKSLREAMLSEYSTYGFKLSMMKTVVSLVYAQFLNEIYFYGAHIGYGFRALCHTGAQSFPAASNFREELEIISSGIRGAAMSGGHTIRLMAGYHHLLSIYLAGVIGNLGRSVGLSSAFEMALALNLPTIAGGFGVPNYTELFTNLAGHRDVEKLDKCRRLIRCVTRHPGLNRVKNRLGEFIRTCLRASQRTSEDRVPDRIGIRHSVMTKLSIRDRDVSIAKAALAICRNPDAEILLEKFISGVGTSSRSSFAKGFILASRNITSPIPAIIVQKAIGSDPDKVIGQLIRKIVSSSMIDRFLTRSQIGRLRRLYSADARERFSDVFAAIN